MAGTGSAFWKKKVPHSHLFHRCKRDERGAALIEFAIIAAPFIALVIAIVQTSLTMFTQQVLETSVEKSGRMILTGTAQKQGLSQSAFKNKVCDTLPSFMRCDDLFVDVAVVSSFSDADLNRERVTFDKNTGNINSNTKYDPGSPGDIVVLRLLYRSNVLSGPLGYDISNMQGERRLLVATSVFKNETY